MLLLGVPFTRRQALILLFGLSQGLSLVLRLDRSLRRLLLYLHQVLGRLPEYFLQIRACIAQRNGLNLGWGIAVRLIRGIRHSAGLVEPGWHGYLYLTAVFYDLHQIEGPIFLLVFQLDL